MVSDESVSQALEQAGDSIANQLLAHPGVEEGKSRFADRDSLFLRGKEFFHLDAPGLADVRLGRKLIRSHRDELKAEPLVVLRTDTSDWVNVRFTNMDEAATVVRWAEMAIDAG